MTKDISQQTRLTAEQARWRCDPGRLGFKSTLEVTVSHEILGQEGAVDALQFGLESKAHGTNIFVRGLSGFGRMALIHQRIKESQLNRSPAPDRCYLHNFQSPDQPVLLSLAPGSAPLFRAAMDRFAEFVEQELPAYLSSDRLQSKQKALAAGIQSEIQAVSNPFNAELSAAGLTMVPIQVGENMLPAILPVIDGEPVQFDELQSRVTQGKLSEDEFNRLMQLVSEFEIRFGQIGQNIATIQGRYQEALGQLMTSEADSYVGARIAAIGEKFDLPDVHEFLAQVQQDLIGQRLSELGNAQSFVRQYRVRVVRSHIAGESYPVVTVTNPSLANLVGKIDREFTQNTMAGLSDHHMIRSGALLEADGGYLILDARDLLHEPGAWDALARTLKTGELEISNTDPFGLWAAPQLRPAPIPVDIKVILVGDPDIYAALDAYEPRFATNFKVLADFSDTIRRDDAGMNAYVSVIRRIIEQDNLVPFSAAAVGAVIEHGARICAQNNRLTSRFGRIADIVRESAYIAQRENREEVSGDDVRLSIQRSKKRAALPVSRFNRLIEDGTLLIDVSGRVSGQVNGLAVTSAGPLVYGFPARITASIGPGNAGAVNIERESDLSGAVHTKGFLILSGLLRYLLNLPHPMAFSSSIAFEQTYGGVDGDSASGAEFCCLISALTDKPIRQEIAMTGAIDQKGNILPIGAATEKIEGFFDACQALGFTGTQGVIIPATNAGELMLRHDIVEAIRAGSFNVHAVSRIEQAMAILMDAEPGDCLSRHYAKGTLLDIASARAHEFWEAARKPAATSNEPAAT